MVFSVKTCVIIRGLSGSGKSTLAKQITNSHKDYTCAIHETDSLLYDKDGNYNIDIDIKKMGEYHQKNFELFSKSIINGTHIVINSNTNTQLWEFNHYVELAVQNGYSIMIFDLYDAGLTNQELFDRNSHNFPLDKYEIVRSHYERNYSNLDSRKPWERGES
jgi:NEDD4-binding protein 2